MHWLRRTVWTVTQLAMVPRRWRLPIFFLLGVFVGTGLLVAHLSRATSYLSDQPETCINCHVMNTWYVTWQHSSHAHVATCTDCHVPHDNYISHYAYKARDGAWHATVFTMRWEPEVIRLAERAIPVVEQNCRRCHERLIDETALEVHAPGDLRCWDCHRDVPHGTVRSLSSAPDTFRPELPPVGIFREPLRIHERPVRPDGERGLP